MAERSVGSTMLTWYPIPRFLKTFAACASSRWKISEHSRLRIKPSLEGTAADSFNSVVRTDIFSTDLSGSMKCIPDDRTSPVTRPNFVVTPTFPAGIVVTEENTTITSRTANIAAPTAREMAVQPKTVGRCSNPLLKWDMKPPWNAAGQHLLHCT